MRFYTLPPSGISYPYLLVNPRNYKVLFRLKFKHAILDCGVEIFHKNRNLKEYPKSFLKIWQFRAKQLTEIFGSKLWVTIPDYPDDYHPGQFGDNVSRTLVNIKKFVAVDGVNWLPPIQSHFLNPFSFFESCERIKEIIGGDYPRVAIGTVCKTNKLSYIEYCCKVARKFFPKSHIHAFGLTLKALPRVIPARKSWDSIVCDAGRRKWTQKLLNSFDSLAYSRDPGGRPGIKHCQNLSERKRFFFAYLERINQILGKKSLVEMKT